MKLININERLIGNKTPPYIIAEMSANHNGDIKINKRNALEVIFTIICLFSIY